MLLQFNFSNFKSFRDETTLDMTATKISEHSFHVIEQGNERILPVTAIFGANASGKSNVYNAFEFMCQYVSASLRFGGEKEEIITPRPFLFDKKSSSADSVFEVYFTAGEEHSFRTYNYGFSINKTGVTEEWLNTKAKTSRDNFKKIFYRKRDQLDLSGIPTKSRDNIEISLEKETLIVSLGSKLKINILKYVYDWFRNCEILNFGDPMENLILSGRIHTSFADNEKVRKDVISYLSSFDSSIIDFVIEKVPSEDETKRQKYSIDAVHKMGDSNETVFLPLSQESAGTQKMFILYFYLKQVMENGSVLFVDELNSRLHPLLSRNILIGFLNKDINRNNAQLIFTTHDSWILDSDTLRRDEIWFTEKGENGITELYSLADFVDEKGYKIRKDEAYQKNYLLGKYGAIPTIKRFDFSE